MSGAPLVLEEAERFMCRALTRIRLRTSPDVNSAPTGERLEINEIFRVTEVAYRDGFSLLKLEGREGWVMDKGVKGEWMNKPIIEQVAETPTSFVSISGEALGRLDEAAAKGKEASRQESLYTGFGDPEEERAARAIRQILAQARCAKPEDREALAKELMQALETNWHQLGSLQKSLSRQVAQTIERMTEASRRSQAMSILQGTRAFPTCPDSAAVDANTS